MKPLSILPAVTLLMLLPTPITSWGNLGHRTIAYLAEKHLNTRGHAYIQGILGDEDISDAAIWADFYKYTPLGWHTSSWHYINAHDDPPSSCGLEQERDCSGKKKCIINAIADMVHLPQAPKNPKIPFYCLPDPKPRLIFNNTIQTEKLTNAKNRDQKSQKLRALKFLLHLIGDLHNPLHVEGLAKGGNKIKVLFEGRSTNLHFLWDFEMLLRYTGSTKVNEIEAAKDWAEKLFNGGSENNGLPEDEIWRAREGVVGVQVEELMLAWAKETNRWVCEYVLRDGVEAIVGKELAGDYYEGAVPIVEELIGKAGRRLAGFINALAERERALGLVEDGIGEL